MPAFIIADTNAHGVDIRTRVKKVGYKEFLKTDILIPLLTLVIIRNHCFHFNVRFHLKIAPSDMMLI